MSRFIILNLLCTAFVFYSSYANAESFCSVEGSELSKEVSPISHDMALVKIRCNLPDNTSVDTEEVLKLFPKGAKISTRPGVVIIAYISPRDTIEESSQLVYPGKFNTYCSYGVMTFGGCKGRRIHHQCYDSGIAASECSRKNDWPCTWLSLAQFDKNCP